MLHMGTADMEAALGIPRSIFEEVRALDYQEGQALLSRLFP